MDERLRIRFSYLVMNDIMKIVKEEVPEILERHFELECEMLLSIRQKDMPVLRSRLAQIESVDFLD